MVHLRALGLEFQQVFILVSKELNQAPGKPGLFVQGKAVRILAGPDAQGSFCRLHVIRKLGQDVFFIVIDHNFVFSVKSVKKAVAAVVRAPQNVADNYIIAGKVTHCAGTGPDYGPFHFLYVLNLFINHVLCFLVL